jgi:aspartyl/asparaginyl-tRNA synthetase
MTQLSPTAIKDALQSAAPIDSIQVQGWVRTRRDSKDFSFIELNDGSSLRNLQIIARNTLPNYAALQRLNTGASVRVTGALVASQGKGQKWELVADNIQIVGAADDSYPLQKKGHTPEFLREIAHLRLVQIFSAAFFVCAAGWRLPFTSFSRSAVSFTFTRLSSPAAIARAQENCFAYRLSISKIHREKMGGSISRRTSLHDRPI